MEWKDFLDCEHWFANARPLDSRFLRIWKMRIRSLLILHLVQVKILHFQYDHLYISVYLRYLYELQNPGLTINLKLFCLFRQLILKQFCRHILFKFMQVSLLYLSSIWLLYISSFYFCFIDLFSLVYKLHEIWGVVFSILF